MAWIDSFLARLVTLLHPLLIEIRNRLLTIIRIDSRMAMEILKRVNTLEKGEGIAAELRGILLKWGILAILAIALLGLILSLVIRMIRGGKGMAFSRVPALLLAVPYLIILIWLAFSLGFADSLRQTLNGMPEKGAKALLVALGLQAFAAPHRFAMRRPVSAVIQTLGVLPLAMGARLFTGLSPMSIVALSDEMVAAALFIAIGALFILWRLIDVFLVLFGGLNARVPRKAYRK